MDFRDFVDLNLNELRNFKVQALSSDPANTTARLYYNTTANELRYHNGTTWVALTAGASYTDEAAQDAIAAAFAAGTNTVVTVTYNDASNSFSLTIGAGQVTTAMLASGVRLDTINAPSASVSLNSQKITSLQDPTAAQDAATKAYVDALAQGLAPKESVRAATTAAGTLASSFENGDVIDGVTLATGDRILIKDQAAGAENGIYTVNASGAPTRALDADSSNDLRGATVWVEEGTANADSGWVLVTNAPITVGTTALVFTQNSGLGQVTVTAPLTKTGNNLALDITSTTHVARAWSGATTGGATSEVITHNLNTRDVHVQTFDQNTPWGQVFFTVEATSVNTITLRSGANIAAGLRVVVHA